MKLLYGLLVLSLCGALNAQTEKLHGAPQVPQHGAQTYVQSGSFHFDYSGNSPVTLTLEGAQNFQETVKGELILSNLFPGDYMLTVGSTQRGRAALLKQPVKILPAVRVIFQLSENGRHTTSTNADRNSIPLAIAQTQTQTHAHTVAGQPIPDADFKRILQDVKKEGFETTRLRAIQVNTGFYPYLSTKQVRELALLFGFETNRLACVKDLAPKVIDRENLPSLANLFAFSSNKEQYFDLLLRLQRGY